MSSTTYMLERDLPPLILDTTYRDVIDHAPLNNACVKQLRDALEGVFEITLRIVPHGKFRTWPSGLYVNGEPKLVRKGKFKPVTVYPNTTIVQGTPEEEGGSNAYPGISFVEDEVIVRVVVNGFPHMQHEHGIHILDIQRKP